MKFKDRKIFLATLATLILPNFPCVKVVHAADADIIVIDEDYKIAKSAALDWLNNSGEIIFYGGGGENFSADISRKQIAINGGTLNITAGNTRIGSAGESGMDAENADPYISDSATYNWTAASGNSGGQQPGGTTSGDQQPGGNTTSGDQTPGGNTTSGDQTPGDNTNTNTGTTTLPVTPTVKTLNDGTVFTLFPSDGSVETDTEGARNIPSSGSTFPIVHRVNDFAGLTTN